MNNEELKNSQEELDTENFGTLVDYYLARKVIPLTAMKKVIIRQQVSFAFEWYINQYMRIGTKEAFDFATYVCLVQAEPDYYGNYIELLLEEFKIKEDCIEKALTHIRLGVVPYQLWIDKCISDIKCGGEYFSAQSVPSLVFTYLMNTMRTSIIGYLKLYKALLDPDNNVKEEIKEVVYAAHVYFSEMPPNMKEEYMQAFSSEDEDVRRIFQDNELSLFSETIIDMLRHPLNLQRYLEIEEGKVSAYSKFWSDPMNTSAPIINRSRGSEAIEKAARAREKLFLPEQRGGMGDFAMDVLGYGPNGETPEEMREKLRKANEETAAILEDIGEEIENANTKFVVEKVAKDSSSRVMSKNTFDTRAEAENFIKTVSESAPDMLRSFDFRIREVSAD